MKLHYNPDGSIQMILNFKGNIIKKTFLKKEEYYNYLKTFSM
ncbi:hypothetical protein HMPREF1049_0137 [Fusobacterium necrophorum subsp. funduliforme ATCC 51357]|nr:hypothetical protein HMPREF1049_0137 [Fusobacterium necrophorum subsp. funduliforme ATCC 51357]